MKESSNYWRYGHAQDVYLFRLSYDHMSIAKNSRPAHACPVSFKISVTEALRAVKYMSCIGPLKLSVNISQTIPICVFHPKGQLNYINL